MLLTVNGTTHELDVSGHETLLGVLRDRLSLCWHQALVRTR